MQKLDGIVGTCFSYAIVENCINEGKVICEGVSQGGIVGICYYSIQNCENKGEIINNATTKEKSYFIGGITGHINTSYVTIDTIQNCYYLNTSCSKAVGNISTIDATSSKTSDEMKNLANTLGDDFKNSTSGDGYPKLKWEE